MWDPTDAPLTPVSSEEGGPSTRPAPLKGFWKPQTSFFPIPTHANCPSPAHSRTLIGVQSGNPRPCTHLSSTTRSPLVCHLGNPKIQWISKVTPECLGGQAAWPIDQGMVSPGWDKLWFHSRPLYQFCRVQTLSTPCCVVGHLHRSWGRGECWWLMGGSWTPNLGGSARLPVRTCVLG